MSRNTPATPGEGILVLLQILQIQVIMQLRLGGSDSFIVTWATLKITD